MMPPGVERYVEFMSTLSASSLAGVDAIVTDDMHFRDPFNDVHGRAHFVRCLEDMLHQLDGLRIDVTHVAPLHARGTPADVMPRYALYWHFGGRLNKLGGRAWSVTGVAVIALAADGRVQEHLDYWDAAGGLYEQLPLLGGLLRWVRRRFAVP
jgi:steroid Delta-isomerase